MTILALAEDPRAVALRELAPLLDADEVQWQDRALCSQTDPEAFFPEKGGSTREAKRVCRSCEVRAECLEYALNHDERFGTWGGFSERERRRIRARQIADGTRTPSERACASGRHLLTPDNIYVYPGNGAKTCRACKNERDANRVRDYAKEAA